MINLAGKASADEEIRRELEGCRIPIEEVAPHQGEVSYSLVGRLGDIEFYRRWYYWSANGPVPLVVAQALYADPVGRTDVRVSGDAGSPEPTLYGHHFIGIMPDGKRVLPVELEDGWRGCAKHSSSMKAELAEMIFSDEPESIGATLCVMSYHIDSEAGLRLFADAVRAHLEVHI